MNIRIYLVDDHLLFTDGISRILSEKAGFWVEKVFPDGESLLKAMEMDRPDILFCDLSMPGIPGLTVAKEVLKTWPDVKVILLSMHQGAEHVLPAIKSGVHGYVLKSAHKEELFKAVETVMAGGFYFSPQLNTILQNKSMVQEKAEMFLTVRELHIMKLLVSGLSTKEIAEALLISHHTVEAHRRNLLSKTGCRNSIELINMANDKRWLH